MESVSKTNGMPPSAILSVLGGALMLAGGILSLSMLGLWNQAGVPGMMGWGHMMGGYGMMQGAYASSVIGTMTALSLVTGTVVIAGGYFIYRRPASSKIWGTGIVIASIVGLFGMGGFFIGPLLGIIGGILALVWR
jgi:hypothetical protein